MMFDDDALEGTQNHHDLMIKSI